MVAHARPVNDRGLVWGFWGFCFLFFFGLFCSFFFGFGFWVSVFVVFFGFEILLLGKIVGSTSI